MNKKTASLSICTGLALIWLLQGSIPYHKNPVVLMTDFGLIDAAVGSMKGVILSVDEKLPIVDLTHGITPFNIWESSYRLHQAMQYYPRGSVFVCVIDPGVGTHRRSIVAKLANGSYFVGPDNGIISHVRDYCGIHEVRKIDEKINTVISGKLSDTFHGRDVYAYTGARLAANVISFNQIGSVITDYIVLPIQKPLATGNEIVGSVIVLDGSYGNVWTNIDQESAKTIGLHQETSVLVEIKNASKKILYSSILHLSKTFGDVKIGDPVLYTNSLGMISLGINQGNFACNYRIDPGCSVHLSMLR